MLASKRFSFSQIRSAARAVQRAVVEGELSQASKRGFSQAVCAQTQIQEVNAVKSSLPAALGWAAVGLATASLVTVPYASCAPVSKKSQKAAAGAVDHPVVVFVLGGPGAGKGTQCAKLVEQYAFAHLSAGDLLRAHIKSGTPDGEKVADMIKNGQIVPSEVTVGLLDRAMREENAQTGKTRFLIDGFPRNAENREAFEREMGYDCDFVLFFDCPEDVMETRLLGRNQGRTDDNIESIRKRFKVFVESSMPVVQHYETLGKVNRVIANREVDQVFDSTKVFFEKYLEGDVLNATTSLLASIDAGDWATYQSLVSPKLTAFEPEARGHLVEGLDFHKFYFALAEAAESSGAPVRSHIASPKVTILNGGKSAIITYTRLVQRSFQSGSRTAPSTPQASSARSTPSNQGNWWNPAPPPAAPSASASTPGREVATFSADSTKSFEETRVWELQENGSWLNVHFHKSEV